MGYGYATTNVYLWSSYVYFQVSGSCFEPGDEVYITICDENYVLWLYDEYEDSTDTYIVANDCGAFFAEFWVDISYGYWSDILDYPISVRAWTNAELDEVEEEEYLYQVVDGDLMANWPLYLTYD